MATAFARLGSPEAWGSSSPADEAVSRSLLVRALARVRDSMQRNPFLVSGTGRICTRLMEVLAPRVVAKGGAEGVYCVGVPHLGLGVALKVKDGAARATEPAITAILDALNVLGEEDKTALAGFLRPDVVNNAGDVVGEIQAVLSDEFRQKLMEIGRERRG